LSVELTFRNIFQQVVRVKERQAAQWDAFDAFISQQKNLDASGEMTASHNAIASVQTRKALGTSWSGKLPPLIYQENHWHRQGKWQGDYHDGEEKMGRQYHHRIPPPLKYGIPPPVKYGLFTEPDSVHIVTGKLGDGVVKGRLH